MDTLINQNAHGAKHNQHNFENTLFKYLISVFAFR